jgi:predicted site-specific integrase-resolvase
LLVPQKPTVNTTHQQPLLLAGPSAAAYVGVQPGVLRRWIKEGLPFVRGGRGGKKLYPRKELERWVERLKETAA